MFELRMKMQKKERLQLHLAVTLQNIACKLGPGVLGIYYTRRPFCALKLVTPPTEKATGPGQYTQLSLRTYAFPSNLRIQALYKNVDGFDEKQKCVQSYREFLKHCVFVHSDRNWEIYDESALFQYFEDYAMVQFLELYLSIRECLLGSCDVSMNVYRYVIA